MQAVFGLDDKKKKKIVKKITLIWLSDTTLEVHLTIFIVRDQTMGLVNLSQRVFSK